MTLVPRHLRNLIYSDSSVSFLLDPDRFCRSASKTQVDLRSALNILKGGFYFLKIRFCILAKGDPESSHKSFICQVPSDALFITEHNTIYRPSNSPSCVILPWGVGGQILTNPRVLKLLLSVIINAQSSAIGNI